MYDAFRAQFKKKYPKTPIIKDVQNYKIAKVPGFLKSSVLLNSPAGMHVRVKITLKFRVTQYNTLMFTDST
jgi:hypothetical protein